MWAYLTLAATIFTLFLRHLYVYVPGTFGFIRTRVIVASQRLLSGITVELNSGFMIGLSYDNIINQDKFTIHLVCKAKIGTKTLQLWFTIHLFWFRFWGMIKLFIKLKQVHCSFRTRVCIRIITNCSGCKVNIRYRL